MIKRSFKSSSPLKTVLSSSQLSKKPPPLPSSSNNSSYRCLGWPKCGTELKTMWRSATTNPLTAWSWPRATICTCWDLWFRQAPSLNFWRFRAQKKSWLDWIRLWGRAFLRWRRSSGSMMPSVLGTSNSCRCRTRMSTWTHCISWGAQATTASRCRWEPMKFTRCWRWVRKDNWSK